MTSVVDEIRDLVDWERGLISARIFIDEEIYRLELDRIFGRTWLFLAHDSMIPSPGDFVCTYMGSDPVLVVRQRDGSVKALLNVCRHRGMKVCRADAGNARAFMCTYHGWTYNLAGALASVPNREDAYNRQLDMDAWGLVPIRTESYRGLWFGNFDAAAPPLNTYLGEMKFYIDSWANRSEAGIEILPGTIKWTISGNWKLAAEQFAGDSYHSQITHLSSLGRSVPDLGDQLRREGYQISSRQGHGSSFTSNAQNQAVGRFENSDLQGYIEGRLEEATRRLGPDRPLGAFTVFPNFSGLGANATIRVWHPRGPNRFEIWSWIFTDRDAPEKIKSAQATASAHTDGAAGMVEMDDGENWNLIGQNLLNGHQARLLRWNYQMGLGGEREKHPRYPGLIGQKRLGETPQRGFYRRWLELMTSEEWPSVRTDERTDDLMIGEKAGVDES